MRYGERAIIVPPDYKGADSSGRSYKRKGKRRCRAIKPDGGVCQTILTSYNQDDICYACYKRFACAGQKPVKASAADAANSNAPAEAIPSCPPFSPAE